MNRTKHDSFTAMGSTRHLPLPIFTSKKYLTLLLFSILPPLQFYTHCNFIHSYLKCISLKSIMMASRLDPGYYSLHFLLEGLYNGWMGKVVGGQTWWRVPSSGHTWWRKLSFDVHIDVHECNMHAPQNNKPKILEYHLISLFHLKMDFWAGQ